MTIAFRSQGTVGGGTTGATPGLPSGLTTGDAVLIFVVTKAVTGTTTTITTPTGWTKLAEVFGGPGTEGVGLGPTRSAWFFREKDASWSTMPAISVTNGNSTAVIAMAYSKGAGTTWSTGSTSGVWGNGTRSTSVSATMDANPGLTAGDMVVVGASNEDDADTFSGQSVSATGVSAWGTVTERSETVETTQGGDCGGMVFDTPVTTGTATAAPQVQGTCSSSAGGTINMVRLRESGGSTPTTISGGQATETDTGQAGVAGHLTTNLWTNPSAEGPVSGWSGATVTSDTTRALYGSKSYKLSTSPAQNALWSVGSPAPANSTYTVSAYLWIPSSETGTVQFRLHGTSIPTTLTPAITQRDQWVRASLTVTTDADGGSMFLTPAFGAVGNVWADGVMVTAGPLLYDYFDGDTIDTAANIYNWTGTANASTSTRLATVGPTTISGGQATSVATALAGAVLVAFTLPGGQATETDAALAGTVAEGRVIVGGQATETDTALAGTLNAATVIVGGQAEETDEALAGSAANLTLIYGGQALEVDTALPGDLSLGYAATDTHNRVAGRTRGGYAVATWEPPVADPPPTLVFGEARDTAQAFGAVTMQGAQPVYDVTTATKTRHRTRILVGGKDVSYFRDIPTPLPSYQLVSPLLYGPANLRFPQIHAAFEKMLRNDDGHIIGVDGLPWLAVEKKVVIQRVDEAGVVQATDYKGVIIAFNAAGADLTVEIGGEASGRAALQEKQLPLFRATQDIGQLAFYAIQREIGLPFSPRGGPNTGIKLGRFGGTGMLDYISQLCARAWTRSGNQWTVAPVDGVYKMFRKDTTTIDATAYLDDARTVGDLRRDLAEEPNRIYATGITPHGQRVRFGAYPGLKQGRPAPYPFHNDRAFGVGTTNEDTDTGDGIVVMLGRLQVTKYLRTEDAPGGYDNDAAAAIKDLQEDAGLPQTGTMTAATWRNLFDLDATGYSLRGAAIQPAAQRLYTKVWNRSGSGAIMGRNPAYQPHRLKRDRNIDLGSGFTIQQQREHSRTELAPSDEDNWVGTITFHTGALVAGDHAPGDPITTADVFRARRLQPGMNISLPQFQGGIVVHVSGVSVGDDGKVVATVDTQARDAMAVWEAIQRNRESRKDPARQWIRQHRASGEIKDAIDGWDEVGGIIGDKVTIPGHKWTVFPVVAGQEGTVARLRLNTAPNAEFVVAVFGKKIPPGRLAKRIGNPLDITGNVSSIEVTDGGSGYTSSPDVTIDGGGGSGATAHAVISGGKVVRVNVVNNGTGYTSVPSVSFSGGGGSGAFATANRSGTGSERWTDPQAAKDLDDRLLLYVAGSSDEPCGYFPRTKSGSHPLTGKWQDDAGFSYRTFADPVIYVAVYADRDTTIPAGRIMWPQLEAGA